MMKKKLTVDDLHNLPAIEELGMTEATIKTHYRCQMIVGTKSDVTSTVTIDMTTERFQGLPTATIVTYENGEKSVRFNQADASKLQVRPV